MSRHLAHVPDNLEKPLHQRRGESGMTKPLSYPPPWQDTKTLAQHICVSPSTIENWVAAGIIPPPRKRGGKLMWKWEEVDKQLSEGNNGIPTDATGMRDAVRRERDADGAAGY
jgi:hypothetical protein